MMLCQLKLDIILMGLNVHWSYMPFSPLEGLAYIYNTAAKHLDLALSYTNQSKLWKGVGCTALIHQARPSEQDSVQGVINEVLDIKKSIYKTQQLCEIIQAVYYMYVVRFIHDD